MENNLDSSPLLGNQNPLQPLNRPVTDFSKIVNSAPLQVNQKIETPDLERQEQDASNQERREDRIKRENLLRYYDAEFVQGKRDLTIINREIGELENKIRSEEKEIDILENDYLELDLKMKRIEKNLHRYRFELRSHKGEEMEKRIVQRRLETSVKESEAKLKKIKYGDWRSIRR